MADEQTQNPKDENSYPECGSLLAAAIWLYNPRCPNKLACPVTADDDSDE